MALPLSKYDSTRLKIQRRIQKKGVQVEYGQYHPALLGQATNTDNRVEVRYQVYVLFLDEEQGRDGGSYLPSNELEVLMAGGQAFEPKAGDWLVTPAGKRYPVESVSKLQPDGVPIRYILRLVDG